MPRNLVHGIQIDEVAFCREGMNPEARMLLYKRKDSADPIRKGDDEEPADFASHFGSARAMEIDEALDRRLFALLATTTEIMRADVEDREARILAAVEAYGETMQRDVPALFAGRLAKFLNEWAAQGAADDEAVHAVMKCELEGAGLLGNFTKGETQMNFLATLNKAERTALEYVLGDTSPEDFFKGTSEEVGGLVVALTKRALAATESETALEKAKAEIAKAKIGDAEPVTLEKALEGITDPTARAYFETQGVALKKQGAEITDLQKAAQKSRLETFAKSVPHLANPNGEIVDLLVKCEAAGIREEVEKILVSANHTAKLAKAFEEFGGDSVLGDGNVGTPDEAHEALLAKAIEIRKTRPELTVEKAYDVALEENPDLYAATRGAPAAAH